MNTNRHRAILVVLFTGALVSSLAFLFPALDGVDARSRDVVFEECPSPPDFDTPLGKLATQVRLLRFKFENDAACESGPAWTAAYNLDESLLPKARLAARTYTRRVRERNVHLRGAFDAASKNPGPGNEAPAALTRLMGSADNHCPAPGELLTDLENLVQPVLTLQEAPSACGPSAESAGTLLTSIRVDASVHGAELGDRRPPLQPARKAPPLVADVATGSFSPDQFGMVLAAIAWLDTFLVAVICWLLVRISELRRVEMQAKDAAEKASKLPPEDQPSPQQRDVGSLQELSTGVLLVGYSLVAVAVAVAAWPLAAELVGLSMDARAFTAMASIASACVTSSAAMLARKSVSEAEFFGNVQSLKAQMKGTHVPS